MGELRGIYFKELLFGDSMETTKIILQTIHVLFPPNDEIYIPNMLLRNVISGEGQEGLTGFCHNLSLKRPYVS